jgi:hypothetical protein
MTEQPFVTREHPLCQEWPDHIARVRKAIRQRWDRDMAASLRANGGEHGRG